MSTLKQNNTRANLGNILFLLAPKDNNSEDDHATMIYASEQLGLALTDACILRDLLSTPLEKMDQL